MDVLQIEGIEHCEAKVLRLGLAIINGLCISALITKRRNCKFATHPHGMIAPGVVLQIGSIADFGLLSPCPECPEIGPLE
jgi:hypothetical protein